MNEVITWLRSPEGEEWSLNRMSELQRQHDDSGVFADLLKDDSVWARASWPEPYACDQDLDAPDGEWS